MDFGRYAFLPEKTRQDDRIGRGDAFAFEVRQAVVRLRLRDGQRQPALAESEPVDDFHVETFLLDFVQADDSQIGHAHRHGLRNIVVAQVEHFQREAVAAREQLALAVLDRYARLGEQSDTLFVESSFGLNRYSQHILFV